MILAIDTSTRQAGIALADGSRLRAELSWTAAGNHSRALSRAVINLMELEEAPVELLSAVITASGPGSFSGLRVGISHGKGLAVALDIPVVGISTLDASAFQACESTDQVWAVLPAGRGEVYAAAYEGGWNSFRRTGEYMILSISEAADRAQGLLVGEASEDVAGAASSNRKIRLEPECRRLRRAGFLAELGRRYLDAGGADQRDVLEPLYLRRSAAEERRMEKLS